LAVIEGISLVRTGESRGSLDREGVHERLWEVAPHLVLIGVVFFAEELGWPAGGAGAFVPGSGLDRLAVLVQAERDEEAAQQERSFGVFEWSVVVAEAVGIAVLWCTCRSGPSR
jgi:hypothetical protein